MLKGIACLESSRPFITTPTGATFSSVFINERNVCVVSILRAGDALAEAAQACIPHAPVGKVSTGTPASLQDSVDDRVEAGTGMPGTFTAL